MSLHDPSIEYVSNVQANTPTAHANGLVLAPGTGNISVMKAERTKGAGTSSVVWGNQADLNRQFADEEIDVVENSSIRLFVPGATAKDAATYRSILTWELSILPSEDVVEPETPEETA